MIGRLRDAFQVLKKTALIFIVITVTLYCVKTALTISNIHQTRTIGAGDKQSIRNSSSPSIISVTHSPAYPQPNQRVTITAIITGNPKDIKKVLLIYREKLNYNWYGIHQYWGIYEWSWEPLTWNVYTEWLEREMEPIGNNTYRTELLELPYYSTVWYKVCVIDNSGNWIVSKIKTYMVVRGAEYILYMQVSSIIYRILYVAVGLVLVKGLSKPVEPREKEFEKES